MTIAIALKINDGIVLATDRDDSNSKAVFYDNKHLITVINWDEKRNQKICDGVNDILNQFEVTGIISILKGQPAILLLDLNEGFKEIVKNNIMLRDLKPNNILYINYN